MTKRLRPMSCHDLAYHYSCAMRGRRTWAEVAETPEVVGSDRLLQQLQQPHTLALNCDTFKL